MPYDVKRFIFSVSLCAMLVANPVLATTPTNDEDLGTTHDVYVESTLNQATNGIAGVSYVNRMVNAAGNAAELAEGHAAAAGAHALSAAQSASEAHKVLADKVNIAQGADKKNLAMVTDAEGNITPGHIKPDMIEAAFNYTPAHSSSGYLGYVNVGTDKWAYVWSQIHTNGISNNAVTMDKIAPGAVITEKIADNSIHLGKLRYYNAYASGNVSDGIPLITDGGTGLALSQISSVGIADGAVTIDKTAGVVGMVPVGSADATTYGQFWIE